MMARRYSRMVFLVGVSVAPLAWAQQTEVVVRGGTFVPAGTLLGCTLDEPNFSSQTARVGDPVLCKTASLQMFGRQLIPRGAYLSAHFQDYRDPGHFVGKGWIQLEFTSLTLPGGNVPLSAKVISAARYRVNGDGKVQGHGHPTRDALEWSIPILWPIKVLTLPARGPRPGFKGETRIELRLMEDMVIPESLYAGPDGLIPRSSLQPEKADGTVQPSKLSVPAKQAPQRQGQPADGRHWILVLHGGSRYLVASYWVEKGYLGFTTESGVREALPLTALDIPATTRVNSERGVSFVLAAQER